jgi:MtN3 and saliva related transmembrane protein
MPMMIEALGWLSSLTLLLTIVAQLHKQWASGTSKGVSVWLFIGQTGASLGFVAYSWLVHDRVFVATNALMAGAAMVGLGIVIYHRRRDAAGATPAPSGTRG